MDSGSSLIRLRKAMSAIWQDIFGDDENYVSRYLENYDAECNRIVVYGNKGDVAAFLHYHRFDAGRFTASYIFGVVTVPNYRGRGIARGMISDAMNRMLQNGDTFAMLIAEEDSLKSWYATMGFAVLSEVPVSVSGCDGLSLDNDDKNLNVALYRVVNMRQYLELYASSHEEKSFEVAVVDDMIAVNSATYSVARGMVQVSSLSATGCSGKKPMSPRELLAAYPIECNVTDIVIHKAVPCV